MRKILFAVLLFAIWFIADTEFRLSVLDLSHIYLTFIIADYFDKKAAKVER